MKIRRIVCAIALASAFCAWVTGAGDAFAQGKPAAKGKPPAKAAPAKPQKPAQKPGAKAAPPGKPNGKKGQQGRKAQRRTDGEPDEAARRIIAGNARIAKESPELRALRELDRALFPAPLQHAGAPWPAEGTPIVDRDGPRVIASGLPPSAPLASDPAPRAVDLSWVKGLAMPDIPVRWDARVLRYLEYYKNNPRGRSMVAGFIKRSGRYGAAIRRTLREQGLPEDLLWLSLVESGFDPTIHSHAGAAGLWQFMPDGARIYGLSVDRWADERLDPERSTLAAARYLADLKQRFGTWELAFAAYNMGYGGLLAAIKKYNTNDYWELSRLEAGIPFETALYVPKITAIAIVARNRAVFGCDDVELDPAVSFDKVSVGPGVPLRAIAIAAGAAVERVEELNPDLLAGRTPIAFAPGKTSHVVKVPAGAGLRVSKSLSKLVEGEDKAERVTVRWGETLDDIAAQRHTTRGHLVSLNAVRSSEVIRPGTVLLVPPTPANAPASPLSPPVVIAPAVEVNAPDRSRFFYRVVAGDTPRDLATLFAVSADELCRWNALDGGAALHEGMTLQVFLPSGRGAPDTVKLLAEKDARVLVVGSPAFFDYVEAKKGRTRIEVIAKEGDTFRSIAQRHGLSAAQLERINQRSRSAPLAPGDKVVVYVAKAKEKENKKAREAIPAYEDVGDEIAIAKPLDPPDDEGKQPGKPEPHDDKGEPPAKLPDDPKPPLGI